jgi:uncharacterized protein DUF3618
MATEPSPLPPEPGSDARIDEIQADIGHTRTELGETVEALSANADVTGRVREKVAATKELIGEKAAHALDVTAEMAHVAPSTARHSLPAGPGSVNAAVPIVAVIATAAVAALGVLVWRRR